MKIDLNGESVPYPIVDLAHRDRRERIATAALQGLLSKTLREDATYGDAATHAVIAADALIAELDREATP